MSTSRQTDPIFPRPVSVGLIRGQIVYAGARGEMARPWRFLGVLGETTRGVVQVLHLLEGDEPRWRLVVFAPVEGEGAAAAPGVAFTPATAQRPLVFAWSYLVGESLIAEVCEALRQPERAALAARCLQQMQAAPPLLQPTPTPNPRQTPKKRRLSGCCGCGLLAAGGLLVLAYVAYLANPPLIHNDPGRPVTPPVRDTPEPPTPPLASPGLRTAPPMGQPPEGERAKASDVPTFSRARMVNARKLVASADPSLSEALVCQAELESIANTGDVRAMKLLARTLSQKHEDAASAFLWWRSAAKAGDAESMVQAGRRLRVGMGVPADRAQAFGLFLDAARLHNPDGAYYLGEAYSRGEGTGPAPAQARFLLEEAAGWQQPAAMEAVGWYYLQGTHGFPKSLQTALSYTKAAAQSGRAVAYINLGYCYRQTRPPNRTLANEMTLRGIYLMRHAAQSLDFDAMEEYAVSFETGHGVAKDFAEAKYWRAYASKAGILH